MRTIRRLLVTLALVAAGCGADASEPVLHTAASLTDVAPELVEAYRSDGGIADFDLNIGGSSTLAFQIQDGAPSGVFLSADEETMGLVVGSADAETPVVFARNRLVLVRRPGADVRDLADLADPDLLVGLCSATVPCGRLARAELAARGIEPALDTEEPDVRSLLAKVASGELDAALVYATDVAAAGSTVEVVETDLTESTPYSAAVVGATPPAGSFEFVEFLSSAQAQDILEAAGFEVP